MFKCTRKETVLLFALAIVSLTSIIGNTLLLIHGESNSLHLHKYVIVSFRDEISGNHNASALLLEASKPSPAQSKSNSLSRSKENNRHRDTDSTASNDTVSRYVAHPINDKPGSVHLNMRLTQTKCHTPHCSQFLSRDDKNRFFECFMTVLDKVQYIKNQLDKIPENNCDFMNGTGRSPVALVSPPGSGNTWVRGLLERATGFCTGFNNCDYTIRIKGFIGENINSGSVLVVKTHMLEPQWIGGGGGIRIKDPRIASFGSGIVLLRNPYHSSIAEWRTDRKSVV